MQIVRSGETRLTETPAAAMTTLASPTLGGAATSVWRVDVGPDAPAGPAHVIDAEQIWTFLAGSATVTTPEVTTTLGEGDTVVLPAHLTRQITPAPGTGFSAVVTAPARAAAALPGSDAFQTPPWIS
ncbi:cupin [Actinocorallia sp. A-T 12471]|uniref:cupin n=1 Tax=Actinocorallia sp. A-T 12471 TaxID=3089813 RepID=UPI0029D1178C|nr:cupin [Actinocorallia sp. A-T 12471]MDX6744590.1 cupin [Actinocorallia sp. A-T 12471]